VELIAILFPAEFFVIFVALCSETGPTTCTRFSPKADILSGGIIAAAIEVHRMMGRHGANKA
jgi:hypothetical protein